MRPSTSLLRTVKPKLPQEPVKLFQIPELNSINVEELPNNGFGQGNYSLTKTKFGHWPVYKKVQNTKVTTEIKRIKGDIVQFKNDLLQAYPELDKKQVSINQLAGYVNIKGDRVDIIKQIFEQHIKL